MPPRPLSPQVSNGSHAAGVVGVGGTWPSHRRALASSPQSPGRPGDSRGPGPPAFRAPGRRTGSRDSAGRPAPNTKKEARPGGRAPEALATVMRHRQPPTLHQDAIPWVQLPSRDPLARPPGAGLGASSPCEVRLCSPIHMPVHLGWVTGGLPG